MSVWMEHGDVLLAIESGCFKVYLRHLSPYIRSLPTDNADFEDVPLVRLPHGGIASSADVEALLQLVYKISQPLAQAQFMQVAHVLRAATQFQFPDLREEALARLKELYPPHPTPFTCEGWQYVHEATQLAIDCHAREILPALLYAIVTTSSFDVQDVEHTNDPPSNISMGKEDNSVALDNSRNEETPGSTLSASTTRICQRLMMKIIDHFTPILFTVPTGSHMECTGVFAEHWMAYAVQPAIEDSGVYKPLETLGKIQAVNWVALGLCNACCAEKQGEWEDERDNIWARLEGWAGLEALFSNSDIL